MDALIRRRLRCLCFAIACASGPVAVNAFQVEGSAFHRSASAKQNGDLTFSSAGTSNVHDDAEVDKSLLMRRELDGPGLGPADLSGDEGHNKVYNVDGPDSVKIMTPATNDDQEEPCDPTLLLSTESVSEDMSGKPNKGTLKAGASTTPDPNHMASKLDPNKPEKLGPCAVLSKRMTPAIARGHIVVKAPNGDKSQVPEEQEEHVCIGSMCTKTPTSSTVVAMVTKMCGGIVVLGVLIIIVSRAGQDSKMKKLMADKEKAKEAPMTVERFEAKIAEMVKAGAPAGAIEVEKKAFAKFQADQLAQSAAPAAGAASSSS